MASKQGVARIRGTSFRSPHISLLARSHAAKKTSSNSFKYAHRSSPTTPQSHSRPRSADVPDWEQEDGPTRPSMSTAARRSTSRARRSLSRAPVLTDMGSMERSISRHAVPGLDSSIISLQSSSSIASSPPSSAPHSLERGHGLQKRSPFVTSISRSNSPCILPTTPSDYNMPSMLPISKLERQLSRGRKHYTDNARDPLLSPSSELDAADEWDTLDPRSSIAKEEFSVCKRAESSPPTSTKWADVIHTKFESPPGLYATPPLVIACSTPNGVRSRSMGARR